MSKTFNFYIDETCHLENDKQDVICIGYIKMASIHYSNIKKEIRKIKLKHKSPTEIKWNKLSLSRLELYKELIDYFFDSTLQFRCVLVKKKQNLDHSKYNRGDANAFYYKLVYLLLKNETINPISNEYKVYLDIKDTRGKQRLNELKKCFDNNYKNSSPFCFFQNIRSHENEFIQLSDLFIGAVSFKARKLHLLENASKVKVEIINYLEKKSGYSLNEGSIPWETKFNIFDFQIKVN